MEEKDMTDMVVGSSLFNVFASVSTNIKPCDPFYISQLPFLFNIPFQDFDQSPVYSSIVNFTFDIYVFVWHFVFIYVFVLFCF